MNSIVESLFNTSNESNAEPMPFSGVNLFPFASYSKSFDQLTSATSNRTIEPIEEDPANPLPSPTAADLSEPKKRKRPEKDPEVKSSQLLADARNAESRSELNKVRVQISAFKQRVKRKGDWSETRLEELSEDLKAICKEKEFNKKLKVQSTEQEEAQGRKYLESAQQAKTKNAFRKAREQYFGWKSFQQREGSLPEKRLKELDEELKAVNKTKRFKRTVSGLGQSIKEHIKNYELAFNESTDCRNIVRSNMKNYYYKNRKSFSSTDLKLYKEILAKMDSIRGTRKIRFNMTPKEFMDDIDQKLELDQGKTRVLSDSEYQLKSYHKNNEERFTKKDIAHFDALILQIKQYKKARRKPA